MESQVGKVGEALESELDGKTQSQKQAVLEIAVEDLLEVAERHELGFFAQGRKVG